MRNQLPYHTATTGARFGNWVVISPQPHGKDGHRIADVQCDCGNTATVRLFAILRGKSSKCKECAHKEISAKRSMNVWGRIPDGADAEIYRRWWNIKGRCFDPKDNNFKHYGGRGIKLSEEFLDVRVFSDYLKSLPSFDLTKEIDRIEVNGDYCRGNLRFITQAEQMRNKRNTTFTTYKGERIKAMDFIEKVKTIFSPKYIIRMIRDKGFSGDDIVERSKLIEAGVSIPRRPYKHWKSKKAFTK